MYLVLRFVGQKAAFGLNVSLKLLIHCLRTTPRCESRLDVLLSDPLAAETRSQDAHRTSILEGPVLSQDSRVAMAQCVSSSSKPWQGPEDIASRAGGVREGEEAVIEKTITYSRNGPFQHVIASLMFLLSKCDPLFDAEFIFCPPPLRPHPASPRTSLCLLSRMKNDSHAKGDPNATPASYPYELHHIIWEAVGSIGPLCPTKGRALRLGRERGIAYHSAATRCTCSHGAWGRSGAYRGVAGLTKLAGRRGSLSKARSPSRSE